jgi:hypothetical protein
MARTTIPNVKTLFETGDRPTQSDYTSLIDTATAQATDLGTFGNNENTITGIESSTIVDTFDATEWRMIKYIVSISKLTNGDNKFYATELTVLCDADNISVTEYGTIDNDGNMGTVSVSRIDDTVSLIVTPDAIIRPITVRFARMGLKA